MQELSVRDLLAVIEILVLLGGICVGYGILKSKVENMKNYLDVHCSKAETRFTKIEDRINISDKLIAGMQSDVSNTNKIVQNMSSKLDRLIENLVGTS